MTFTKEQLINQAREEVDFWRERDELIPSQQTAIRLRLAEITLAALTAEPVAYIDPFSLQNFATYRSGETDNKRMGREWMWANPDAGLAPVYTAPPAPVVPKELLSAMEEVLRISDRDHDAWHKAKAGIVSCRAAMLQGAEPVSTDYTLPADVRGAINRLLDSDGSRGTFSAVRSYDAREELERLLAAAPQQEAHNG